MATIRIKEKTVKSIVIGIALLFFLFLLGVLYILSDAEINFRKSETQEISVEKKGN